MEHEYRYTILIATNEDLYFYQIEANDDGDAIKIAKELFKEDEKEGEIIDWIEIRDKEGI